MKKNFEHEIFIPFQLSDGAGIVFFGHVFSLAHEAYEHFVQEILCYSWDSWFNNPEWILPIKQSKAQYSAPLMSGQKYVIDLSILQITLSSVTFTYLFHQSGKEYCRVETTHVFCDRAMKKKQPIPLEIHARLNDYWQT